MTGRSSARRLLLPAVDTAGALGAFLLAVYLRFGQSASELLDYEGLALKAAVNTIVLMLCLYYSGYYEDWPTQRPRETALRALRAVAAGTLLLLAVYYAVSPSVARRRAAHERTEAADRQLGPCPRSTSTERSAGPRRSARPRTRPGGCR